MVKDHGVEYLTNANAVLEVFWDSMNHILYQRLLVNCLDPNTGIANHNDTELPKVWIRRYNNKSPNDIGIPKGTWSAWELMGDSSTIIGTDSIEDGAVTDSKLATDIQTLISSLRKNATFAGIATPTTDPGTPDGPVFYFANQEGTYTNFNGIKLSLGDSSILKYSNGAWEKILFPALDSYNDSDPTNMDDALIYVLTHNGNAIKPMTGFDAVINNKGKTLNEVLQSLLEELIYGKAVVTPWVTMTNPNWTQNKMIKNNVIQDFNGRAVSDLIDVHNYLGRILSFYKATTYTDSQTMVFYAQNGETVIAGYTGKNEIKIPNDAYYVRLSTSNASISDIIILIKGSSDVTYGTDEIKVLKKEIDSIPKSSNWVYGPSFLDYGGTSAVAGSYGIELQPKKYTKFKYINLSSFTRTIYGYIPELGYYLPIGNISLSDLINDGKVHEIDINLDLRDYDRALYLDVNGVWYARGDALYPGRTLYTNIHNIVGQNIDNIDVFSDSICLTIDFKGYGSDEENETPSYVINNIKVSEFFNRKKYVAYGDSITVFTTDGGNYSSYTYPALIAAHFGFILKNRGTSGSRPTGSSNLSDTNLAHVDEDTMLVTISGGANGWTTSEDINTLDRETSVGAINYYIDQIRQISPKCVIVLCPTYNLHGSTDAVTDYQRIAQNKHVGLAPTRNLELINWEDDPEHVLRADGLHHTNYGSLRFAAVCIKYLEQMIL